MSGHASVALLQIAVWYIPSSHEIHGVAVMTGMAGVLLAQFCQPLCNEVRIVTNRHLYTSSRRDCTQTPLFP